MKEKDPYLSELDALEDLEPEEEPTDVRPASSPPELNPGAFTMANDVPIQLVVVMGRKEMTLKDLMDLRSGQIVELESVPHEAVDLVVGGKVMAKGELVEIDGKLGVRVVKLLK